MNTSIINKSYKKLSIQVALNGMSFCVFNSLNNKPIVLQNIHFDSFQRSNKIEDLFSNVFNENPELRHKYDDIVIKSGPYNIIKGELYFYQNIKVISIASTFSTFYISSKNY